jgi:hypothetical protein
MGNDPPILPEGEPLVLNEWEQGLLFLFALVLGLIGLAMLFSAVQHDFHEAARQVAGFWSIAAALFFFQAGRSGLVVEKDGVTLRGIIRRRHWAWREIEGFEIKFVVYFPPLRINLTNGHHVRAPGFRGRSVKDRELSDLRIAELNRRVQDARQTAGRGGSLTGKENGDVLIERILATGDADGRLANQLIGEFYSGGYPVENLIPLLQSEDDATVKTGAFLVQELGSRAAPLLPEVERLLGHRVSWVKADMLDAALNAATPADGSVLARAVMLVDDPDRVVRSEALSFLAGADRAQLLAALPHVVDRRLSEGLGWLVEGDPPEREDVEARLSVDRDRVTRQFAAVAAARTGENDLDLLSVVAESDDDELQSFARSSLRRFSRGGNDGGR